MRKIAEPTTLAITRRRLLRGSALVALGVVISACGGASSSAPTATEGSSITPAGLRGEPVEVWRDPG